MKILIPTRLDYQVLMGKKFKSNEFTSGRMGEILGSLYMIEAMDWFNNHHEGKLDKIVQLARIEEFQKIQHNFQLIAENYPIGGIRHFLQCIHNQSKIEKNIKISDIMIQDVSNSITKNKEIRKILSENTFENYRVKMMNEYLEQILEEGHDKHEWVVDEITRVDVFGKK